MYSYAFHTQCAQASTDPEFSVTLELDLSTVVPSLSGPKRPHDRVALSNMKQDFAACLTNKVGFKGFGLGSEDLKKSAKLSYKGEEHTLKHGDVVIAAITSCTNTSNPSVMLGAGLLARRAVERGLKVKSYVKTSLSPGASGPCLACRAAQPISWQCLLQPCFAVE